MINRALENLISKKLFKGKAIIIMGARQTGKTTLLQHLFDGNKDVLWLNADEHDVRSIFEKTTSSQLKKIIGTKKILVLDEAQRIHDIGLKLKLITDNIKSVQLVVTGSSSFELANKLNEPLTGRKWEYTMYPLSFGEMVAEHGLLEEKRLLTHRLIYGYYPDVINNPGNEKEVLKQLTDSYLYKDILMWERIKRTDKLLKLLQALAFQMGNQVSYHELAQLVGLDNETVEKYITLLEQTYVIFRLSSFTRNLRSELKRSRKIYFYDNGIRNAIIAAFQPTGLRQDIGALWENFIISERMKFNHYNGNICNSYFWRTHSQQEIDYVEESNGKLAAYEFKWNAKRNAIFPKSFESAYQGSSFLNITPDNYEEFIS